MNEMKFNIYAFIYFCMNLSLAFSLFLWTLYFELVLMICDLNFFVFCEVLLSFRNFFQT